MDSTNPNVVPHPMEVAREALIAAAMLEEEDYREAMMRCAVALPRRHPLPSTVHGDDVVAVARVRRGHLELVHGGKAR